MSAGRPRPKPASGQLWRLEFPFGDEPKFKLRTALVVGVSPMGPDDDQIVLLAMVTSQMHVRSAGDVPIPNLSSNYLVKDSLVRARRITFKVVGVFFDPTQSEFMGTVDQGTMNAVHAELSLMF